ncbi:MAG TPA: SAM-dependent methyltransferase [Bacteroidales bacterium]|nr:SAM-dependent methyltransferase [Bacteroidales bacterium]HRC90009.1 SAM-dependent methyltransferase [Bacteroidales bacterium]
MKGKLFLLPVPLGGYNFKDVIPENVIKTTIELRHFIVENEKSARRYLRLIDKDFPVDKSVFMVLDEHSSEKNISVFLDYTLKGIDTGLMSEAGVPGIADPGANLVRLAHTKNIKVVPLSGPSSIILALSASGLNGQNFTFHGYLPVKRDALALKIREIEKKSAKGETQIFMETPYRNQRLLEYLISVCNPDTKLCIAADITLISEEITTRTISEWRNKSPQLKNRLVIFLLNAGY